MSATLASVLSHAASGSRIADSDAHQFSQCGDLVALMRVAAGLRDQGHGNLVSFSRKVFIPLTHLCRDSCHYCTFAQPPKRGEAAYLSRDQVLAIAEAGVRAGCKEALFTLGDKPELRYRAAGYALAALGHDSTISYLIEMAGLVLRETGLLPHINAGVMDQADLERLRSVSVSQGIMLETVSERLSARGGPHFGSPDKIPQIRLDMIAAAGAAQIPFTSGILIGIGETRDERIDALLRLRALDERYGHLQEIIIQNFRAKSGTKMVDAPEPSLDEQLWTIAVARILLGPEANIQSPPNLRPGDLRAVIDAGINDWGGISPVTPDHVNPEAPWPEIARLSRQTAGAGKILVERLAIYPRYLRDAPRWLDRAVQQPTARLADADGFAREDNWVPGAETPLPVSNMGRGAVNRDTSALRRIIDLAVDGKALSEGQIVTLFSARGDDFDLVTAAADRLRESVSGSTVGYVVNRNINYTNVCYFKCKFCAFSKGKLSENLRGRPYDLDLEEIRRRSVEAWARGAIEVCLQGGIHPDYTGETYLSICRAIKQVVPDMHIHAFSPLEVWQGAATLGLSLHDFLEQLKAAGLSSLPGTAAEILDDEIRAVICPDKINTAQWLEVVETAHRVGLRSTATIMFGHVDRTVHWARHLLHIRALQERTGGITEFVPLPFVPMETPLFLRTVARTGPSFREAVLMHAVARLALNPVITNIQTSWVKMGPEGVKTCLHAGANDLGGTLMNETITRAAGAVHGQEMSPGEMAKVLNAIGRPPTQRTTFYGVPLAGQVEASMNAPELLDVINTPARRFERQKSKLLA